MKGGHLTATKLQLAEFAKHFLIPVGTSLCFVSLLLNRFDTGLSFVGASLLGIRTLAFKVYGDIDFLLPSHITFPRFVVRLVPLNIGIP